MAAAARECAQGRQVRSIFQLWQPRRRNRL